MTNRSNVATPDVAFVRTVNKAEGADGLVMAEIKTREFTEMTFTSPKSGGTLSPEAWETFRQVVANNAKDKFRKPLLTRAERIAFKPSNKEFMALKKKRSEPVQLAMQADRTSAGQKVGTWISTRKSKAAEVDAINSGKTKKKTGGVKPLQERVNIHANKALGQIMANADKAKPHHLKNQAKVVELLKEIAKLTKSPTKSVTH